MGWVENAEEEEGEIESPGVVETTKGVLGEAFTGRSF